MKGPLRTLKRKKDGKEEWTEGEEGQRPSKAREPSQRFREHGQWKPSTPSRGFIFFPLLSHPECVHLCSFTISAGRPLVIRNSNRQEVPTEQDCKSRTCAVCRAYDWGSCCPVSVGEQHRLVARLLPFKKVIYWKLTHFYFQVLIFYPRLNWIKQHLPEELSKSHFRSSIGQTGWFRTKQRHDNFSEACNTKWPHLQCQKHLTLCLMPPAKANSWLDFPRLPGDKMRWCEKPWPVTGWLIVISLKGGNSVGDLCDITMSQFPKLCGCKVGVISE